MNPYYNLPPDQKPTQELADQYNSDARLWEKLAPRRRARRKVLRRLLSRKMLKNLGLAEFAQRRPPDDCVGQWVQELLRSECWPQLKVEQPEGSKDPGVQVPVEIMSTKWVGTTALGRELDERVHGLSLHFDQMGPAACRASQMNAVLRLRREIIELWGIDAKFIAESEVLRRYVGERGSREFSIVIGRACGRLPGHPRPGSQREAGS